MKFEQTTLSIDTLGRGTYEITQEVQRAIADSGIDRGLCHLFIQHTSASLVLCENADPSVRSDLETFMAKIVPDGDPVYEHSMEGPDDMPAHIRSILSNMDLTIPVTGGRGALGTWQGIYVWEHRTRANRRHLVITIQGV